MRDFKKLDIWKKSLSFSILIYRITDVFPDKEKFGLIAQLRRASVSIVSNIAEGSARKSETDFARFLEMSLGFAFEIETQLIISKEIGYISEDQYDSLIQSILTIQKQINQLITIIRNSG